MNGHFSQSKKILTAMAVLLLSFFAVFAQPQKLVEANRLLAEGEKIAEVENVESYEQALEKFRSAKRIYQDLKHFDGERKASLEAGLMLHKLGKIALALEEYKRVYQLSGQLGNKISQGQAANYIGVIYSSLGQKKLAFELYNHAVRLFFEADAFYEAIEAINNVGDMYLAFGDKENAKFYYELALPHVREAGDKDREALILQNLGDLYLKFKEYEKALEYFRQSLEILEETGFENGKVWALNDLAVVSFRMNKKSEAIAYLERALRLNHSRFKNEEALTLQNLLSVWKEIGNQKLAVFYGKQAVNKYQELRSSIRTLDPTIQSYYLQTIEDTYRQLADLLIEQGNFTQAEQVLRMLKEEEYFDFVRRDADEISTLNQRVSLNETEQKLLERYKVLAEKVSEISREFSELEKRKDNLTDKEKLRLAELEKQLNDANAAFELFLKKELTAEFGKAKTDDVKFDKNLQEALKKWGNGTVTLYTVVSEDRYRVILTTPNLQIDGKTEISAVELNKKIFAYRDALQDFESDPRPLAKELYDILIKPIEKHLNAANAKTLVWSLDGTLRYIPLSTLSPDGKSYLVERFQNVITTPNTREDFSDVNKEWQALGVGVSEKQTIENPENSDELIEFNPLPGTKDELLTIIKDEKSKDEKGILNGRRFLDKDFTTKNFADSLTAKNADGTGKFSAVHIASHFQLGTNWANSFLLLGNGQILTLKDLKNSSAMDFADVELVTLSACDTAFTNDSNGKEVDSLASVIQAKNGKAVLAALWAVADESTPLLMSEFYRLRKENPNMSKAEAMQKVQQAFIKGELKPNDEYIKKLDDYLRSKNKSFDRNAPFAHPYFWSPFVLIGNWR